MSAVRTVAANAAALEAASMVTYVSQAAAFPANAASLPDGVHPTICAQHAMGAPLVDGLSAAGWLDRL
ncbi:hypothetical protein GRI62_06450 [Erythrobacter arachoides]|uniref:Uncharacterized protein n=1 Tax=Aurantiacibacter arachoides TaxID=1850444 RepID=A0A845A274_9SPHN|nr:hypothetical protein [Aurantiacibacter arachoides]MXO93246.1 hypothetical protein [Aurantiacibacter arachoides]